MWTLDKYPNNSDTNVDDANEGEYGLPTSQNYCSNHNTIKSLKIDYEMLDKL